MANASDVPALVCYLLSLLPRNLIKTSSSVVSSFPQTDHFSGESSNSKNLLHLQICFVWIVQIVVLVTLVPSFTIICRCVSKDTLGKHSSWMCYAQTQKEHNWILFPAISWTHTCQHEYKDFDAKRWAREWSFSWGTIVAISEWDLIPVGQ